MSKTVEEIAQICHETNRTYCLAIGDDSQLPWDEAPQWQKDSAISGVRFLQEHPDMGPKDSHDAWCKHKLQEGWRWGEVKDPEKKEHPCLAAFDELPITQQAKDYIFLAIVRSLS